MRARDLALILALHPDHEVQIKHAEDGGDVWLTLSVSEVEITTDYILGLEEDRPVVNLG